MIIKFVAINQEIFIYSLNTGKFSNWILDNRIIPGSTDYKTVIFGWVNYFGSKFFSNILKFGFSLSLYRLLIDVNLLIEEVLDWNVTWQFLLLSHSDWLLGLFKSLQKIGVVMLHGVYHFVVFFDLIISLR